MKKSIFFQSRSRLKREKQRKRHGTKPTSEVKQCGLIKTSGKNKTNINGSFIVLRHNVCVMIHEKQKQKPRFYEVGFKAMDERERVRQRESKERFFRGLRENG
jgi:predicted small secreted protein